MNNTIKICVAIATGVLLDRMILINSKKSLVSVKPLEYQSEPEANQVYNNLIQRASARGYISAAEYKMQSDAPVSGIDYSYGWSYDDLLLFNIAGPDKDGKYKLIPTTPKLIG